MAEVKKEFVIESIWGTKVDFTAKTPVHVLKAEWKPSANLDLDVQSEQLDKNRHVVNLVIKVDVSIDDKDVFSLESTHTGVFQVSGYEGDELEQIIASFCPSIIYPYARERVSAIVSNAGFPPLHLSPVDFDARYRASKKTQS